jgi:Ca2+-binding EF-hand superfamily protein
MRFSSSLILCAAALSLGLAGCATDRDTRPAFVDLDKDGDGALTRSEAAGNPELLARFNELDKDGDGRLSRTEYLQWAAGKDIRGVRERAADVIDPDERPAATGGSGARR